MANASNPHFPRWIWLSCGENVDQYGDFYDSFFFGGKQAKLRISADSNYAVYLNGSLVSSGQYPDFPHYKIYDELDVTAHCLDGLNHLAIVVWHYGKSDMSYYPGRAALRYELLSDGAVLCHSGERTLSRQSPCYACGRAKEITGQLGFGFRYDLTREDGWMSGDLNGFTPSAVVEQALPLFPRPVLRPRTGNPAGSRCILNEENTRFIYDLGREECGFLALKIRSAAEQDVLIAYGEHLEDGGVRRLIGPRDFSVEVRLRSGENSYVNPFRRLGLRYLECSAEHPVEIGLLSVLPVEYPVQLSADIPPMNDLQKRIYDVCVRTLHLCMHEHYEDTPWREQALYAMDSRNQMLCGYCAFEEYAFPRANLLLIGKDHRSDGLLSICTPSKNDLTIPSFSLHYFTAVLEYTVHSGDLSLARELWPKLTALLAVFTDRLEDGLVPVFTEACHWNFYEWSEGLSGGLYCVDGRRFDAALNCLLAMALHSMQKLSDLLHVDADYSGLAAEVSAAVRRRFFDPERGFFVNSTEDRSGSMLVNALAILCSAAQGETADSLAALLASDDHGLTPATLSMLCFVYDALLQVDREKYAPHILCDIEKKYRKMLDAGATSFWETEAGQRDFDNAGSLCHGWSAMPVYYFHLLL